jgi:histidyl-tRNA synthetase
VQVDFDIVGADSASADLEILLLMRECMKCLGMEKSRIHFSHRGIFNDFLGRLDLRSRSEEVLRAIDKERKIGEADTKQMLAEIVGPEAASQVMSFTRTEGDFAATIKKLEEGAGKECEGVSRIAAIGRGLEEAGASGSFVLDPSITRGLDYYTGIVFETFLDELPSIGSICSGGRYNDLASLYTHQRLPGVGSSIGLDRLMAAMEELGLEGSAPPCASTLVLCLEDGLLGSYHRFGEAFRAAGLAAEVYPEKRKLAVQFTYAEKKGIPLAIVCGEEEAKAGQVVLKDLRTRQSHGPFSLESAIEKARLLLI